MAPRIETNITKVYSFQRQIKDFWKYAKGYHKQVILLLIIATITALIGLLPPYLFGKIIDLLTSGNYEQITLLIILTALGHIGFLTGHNIISYFVKVTAERIKNNSKIISFKHLFNMDFSFYEEKPIGELVQRIEKGSESIRKFTKEWLQSISLILLRTIFILGILFFIDYRIGLFSIIIIIGFILFTKRTTEELVKLENKTRSIGEKTYGKIYDFLTNFRVVKLLNVQNKLMKHINNSYEKEISYHKKQRLYERQRVASQKIILELSNIVTLAGVTYGVINNMISIGTAVMIITYFNRMMEFSKQLWAKHIELLPAKTAMYRLKLILDSKSKIPEPENPKKIKNWNSISFNDLNFEYASGKGVHNINFEIKKGEKVAIIGTTGSGKSTLIKLLMKMHNPKNGSITINGFKQNNLDKINIKDITSEDLYEFFKIVPQDNELINTTIWENLQFSTKKKITKKDAIIALKKAAIWKFINKTKDKLNTIVGPDGMLISGGEKQRICIARALLAKPEILVLDEATSNLDPKTEETLHKMLAKEKQTIIAVTHRLHTLDMFDKVICIKNGIIEHIMRN